MPTSQVVDPPRVVVINPFGAAWTTRFKTEDAAWARLTALKRRSDNDKSRKLLLDQGWKVQRQ